MNQNPMFGPGGAPTRVTTLPDTAAGRKEFPIASGVLDYFPDALAAIANVSKKGNDQHNPGQSLRWDRSKSGDESDCIIRHFMQRGTNDSDGIRHTAKLAWRALALLQKEIEAEQKAGVNKLPTPAKSRPRYTIARMRRDTPDFSPIVYCVMDSVTQECAPFGNEDSANAGLDIIEAGGKGYKWHPLSEYEEIPELLIGAAALAPEA
jgi:hypothetical protein